MTYDVAVPPADAPTSPSFIVPILAGIGNAVMTVPLVRALAVLGRGEVVVAARTAAMADVFGRLPEVGRVVVLGSKAGEAWKRHRRLAREHADAYVVPFPSNRWQYSLLAATAGTRRVVMHDYPTGRFRGGRFAASLRGRTTFVPAERGLHDVPQNLRLLAALEMDESRLPAGVRRPIFPLDADDRRAGRGLFEGEGFVAVQAGCGDTTVGRAKRPPTVFFSELCDELADRGHAVVVVEGPDERGVGRAVSAGSKSRPPVVELRGKLGAAAALLERASLYVGVDSGLAHVAAAVGTPPVTLFAAADPARVAPFGHADLVVTPPDVNGQSWSPRLLYPMDHPGPRLRDDGIDWANHLRLGDVLAAVDRATETPPQAARVESDDRRDLAAAR